MDPAVEPCFWCGGAARVEGFAVPGRQKEYFVRCPNCKATGPNGLDPHPAAMLWNRVAEVVKVAEPATRSQHSQAGAF